MTKNTWETTPNGERSPTLETWNDFLDCARVGNPEGNPGDYKLEQRPGLFLEALAHRFWEPKRSDLAARLAGAEGRQIVDAFKNRVARELARLGLTRVAELQPPETKRPEPETTMVCLGLQVLGVDSSTLERWLRKLS